MKNKEVVSLGHESDYLMSIYERGEGEREGGRKEASVPGSSYFKIITGRTPS